MPEEAFQNLAGLFRQLRFVEGGCHQFEPAVPRAFVYDEGRVAHAEPGVAALFDVAHGPAEPAHEEVAQPLFGSGQVIGGIHGSENVITGDSAVEGSDEAGEPVLADRAINLIFGQTLILARSR